MDIPLINGQRMSWASVEVDIETVTQELIKGVDYANSLEPGKVRGRGSRLQGDTQGNLDTSASITFSEEGYRIFIKSLGDGYMKKKWNMVVKYQANETDAVEVDTLEGCRLTKPAHSASNGTDGLEVKCDLFVTRILESGLDPLGKGIA